ncbi:MAG: hypothetical protein EP330_25455 [Deltaproteobacteria bacterium]|nr:MAG: hypothetical protein EP330_25455 [Deltaproteobacteria bacterium]
MFLLLSLALACDPSATSEDPLVRRDQVEACARVVSAASWNEGLAHGVTEARLRAWAEDEDIRVRVATHHLIADLGDEALFPAASEILERVLRADSPHPRDLRTALAALHHVTRRGMLTPEHAWALGRPYLSNPQGPGLAAASSLGRLRTAFGTEAPADLPAALDEVLIAHPEATWAFWYRWRHALPWDEARLTRLLDATVGLHAGLLRAWAGGNEAGLVRVLSEWSARAPADRVATCRSMLASSPGAVLDALPGGSEADRMP